LKKRDVKVMLFEISERWWKRKKFDQSLWKL